MQRASFALLALSIAAAPARADCDHFKWSVAKERAWFAASPPALPAQGGVADAGAAYALTLARDLKLPFAPERAPGKDSYAAIVEAPKLAAGAYQITLSDEAWIDVAQGGTLLKSRDFSGQRDCPGVRKTVRFDLSAAAATVQISNAAADRILFAISPAP